MGSARDQVDNWTTRFERGLEDGLYQVAGEIVEASKPIIAAEAIDTHTLLDSTEIVQVGRLHWEARWNAAHAAPVNDGSRPHWPPLDPILAWVKRNVRLVPQATDEGPSLKPQFKPRQRAGTKRVADPEALRIANAIRATIAKKGTEPVNFKERAIRQVEPRMQTIIDENVRRALDGHPAGGP